MPIRDVGDAMDEAARKGWSRKQAIAIGLKAQRSGKAIGGRSARVRPTAAGERRRGR